MDKLDRLLAAMDQKMADAQGALAALAAARSHVLPGDHTLALSVWRRGAAGKPAKTLSLPSDAQGGHSAHQQMQEKACHQRVATAARALQQSMLSLSALLAAGPHLRRLDAWPTLHIHMTLDGALGLLSLKNHSPTGCENAQVWPWECRTFHRACRLLVDTQAHMGHGPAWTVSQNAIDRPSKARNALDAKTALVLHALTGYPGILEHQRTAALLLSRIEPDLPTLVAELQGTDAHCPVPRAPAF